MRIILLILLLSFRAVSQDKLTLQKKLDSLKQEQSKLELTIKSLQKEISLISVKLELITASDSTAEFKKISVVTEEEVLFLTEGNDGMRKIPEDSKIDIVGYKSEFDEITGKMYYLKAIYKGKIGHIPFFYFSKNDEVVKQFQAAKKREEEIAHAKYKKIGSPLAINFVSVETNSIGGSVANVSVSNISNKIVDGFEVSISCYDNYERPVNHYAYKTNKYKGISQDEIKMDFEEASSWTLHGHDNTTKIIVSLVSVHFKDGKVWRPTKPVTMKSF